MSRQSEALAFMVALVIMVAIAVLAYGAIAFGPGR